MRIHHIGYLVKRLEKAKDVLQSGGYTVIQDAVYDEIRGVDIAFLEKDGYVIELVSPKTKDSVVASLIRTYKNAPYHICYSSDDLEADMKRLRERGFIGIDEPTPAPALGGRRVCFFMSPHIGMVELLEEKRCLTEQKKTAKASGG